MANDTSKERVGIIGVGRMGLAMAKHLIRHGYAIAACDVNADNAAKAAELGAHVFGTPRELAETATFVILGVGYGFWRSRRVRFRGLIAKPDGSVTIFPTRSR